MNDKLLAFTVSLGIHLVALAALAVSFSHQPVSMNAAAPRFEAMETVAVDERHVQEEMRRLKSQEQARQEAEEARQRRLAQEAQQAQVTREEEERKIAELKQQRELQEREQKAAEEKERKQLAELKAEQARLSAEAKKIAQKQKDDEKRKMEAELLRKLAAEAEAESGRNKSEHVNRYKADIANKVSRNWLRPAGTAGEVSCRVRVHQLPGGEVVDVKLEKSCGNPALDRSVEAAVRKASPLPPPPTPDVFDREIAFEFKGK